MENTPDRGKYSQRKDLNLQVKMTYCDSGKNDIVQSTLFCVILSSVPNPSNM